MSKLTTLGVLRLSTNQLSEISPVVLQSYTNLQLLDVSRNTFTEIPSGMTSHPCHFVPRSSITGLSHMTRLARLEMHCNRVTNVTVQLSHLGELQVVDLSTNNLDALPASLALCTSLRILVRVSFLAQVDTNILIRI